MWNMKMTSRQMASEVKRCEKKQVEAEKKCSKYMKDGKEDMARMAAAEAVQQKNQAINFMRMSGRLEAVAARVEMAIKMNMLSKTMMGVTAGMDAILGTMDPEKIEKVMAKFEKQFEDMDVRAGTMDRSIGQSTASSVPEEEIETVMAKAKAERDLHDKEKMIAAGGGSVAGPVAAAKGPEAVAAAGAPPPGSSSSDGKGGPPPSAPPAGGAGGAGDHPPPSGGGGGDGGLAARLAALRR